LKAFDSVGQWFRGARYSEQQYTRGDDQIEGSLLVTDPPGENHKETGSYLGNLIAPSVISIILIVIGSFQALVTFIGIVEFSFFFLTVLGLLILRFREPNLNRPFRPHITIPLTFCLISGVIVVRSAILLPMQIMAFITVLAVGLVYRYWATRRLRSIDRHDVIYHSPSVVLHAS
jgi:amino acid transporter